MGLFDKYLEEDDSQKDDKQFFGVGESKKKQEDENQNDTNEEYISLQDKKTEQEIRKLKITNETTLRKLIEKDLVTAIIGEIGQSVQHNFIDQAKMKANTWSMLLGIPGKERDIEKLISDMIEEGINGFTGDIDRLVNDGVFD